MAWLRYRAFEENVRTFLKSRTILEGFRTSFTWRNSKAEEDHFKKRFARMASHWSMHTSNFRKVKRIPDVMHVFNNIHKEIPAKLLMIGDGLNARLWTNGAWVSYCWWCAILGKLETVEEVLSVADLFWCLPKKKFWIGRFGNYGLKCTRDLNQRWRIARVEYSRQDRFHSNLGDIGDILKKHSWFWIKTICPASKPTHSNAQTEFWHRKILPQYEITMRPWFRKTEKRVGASFWITLVSYLSGYEENTVHYFNNWFNHCVCPVWR